MPAEIETMTIFIITLGPVLAAYAIAAIIHAHTNEVTA
tara:strand:- start:6978 stop:7091 length:114 start_codon:yes stop_codon:yes gene_type:complete